jgi:hypothetical protein
MNQSGGGKKMPYAVGIEKKPITITSEFNFKQFQLEDEIATALRTAGVSDISGLHNEFLIFDLSNSYWHDLGALLWLISLLHKLRKQGNDLQLILPNPDEKKGKTVWDFLNRWRFFEALAICVDDPVNLLQPRQVPFMSKQGRYALPTKKDEYGRETFLHSLRLLEITTILPKVAKLSDDPLEQFLAKYNDKIILSALSQLCGWDYSATKNFVQLVFIESLQNTFLHSEGSFSNVSMLLDKKNLTLVIADNGIGIPKVLRSAFKASNINKDLLRKSDVDLIKYFTEPDMVLDSRLIKFSVEKGATSKPGRKGLGLYYLKSLVLSRGGELRIRSGKACIDFIKEKAESQDSLLDSPGTMLRIRTPLKNGK